MNKLITFFILITLNITLSFDKYFLLNAQKIQTRCQGWVHSNSYYSHLNEALICGTPVDNSKEKSLLNRSGLVHLIVVSGGHLQLFLFILSRFFSNRLLLGFILAYTFMTGFQAPIVRAALSAIYNMLFEDEVYQIGPIQRELVVLSSVLALFPSYFTSLSLALSSIAALTISQRKDDNILRRSAWVFLALALPLSTISGLNIISIIINATLGCFIAFALLPICLLTSLPYHPFLSFLDHLWSSLFLAIESIPELNIENKTGWSVHLVLPTYLFILVALHLNLFKNFRPSDYWSFR